MEIVKKYEEIFKTDDAQEFCTKIFNRVKKDYGYENLDISFSVMYPQERFVCPATPEAYWRNGHIEIHVHAPK